MFASYMQPTVIHPKLLSKPDLSWPRFCFLDLCLVSLSVALFLMRFSSWCLLPSRLSLVNAEALFLASNWGSLKAEARSFPSDWGLSLERGHASILGPGPFPVLVRGFAYSLPASMSWGCGGDPDQNCSQVLALPSARAAQPSCLRAPKGTLAEPGSEGRFDRRPWRQQLNVFQCQEQTLY